MTVKEFNDLRARQKWTEWKEQTGVWVCPRCGTELVDGPVRADLFPGSSVHCSECDQELTRRTGGGQADPFWWVLREASPEPKQDPPDLPALTLEDWKTLNTLLDRFVDLAFRRAEAFGSPGTTIFFDGDMDRTGLSLILSDRFNESRVRFTPDELLMSEAEWKCWVEEQKAEKQARLIVSEEEPHDEN